VDHTQTKISKSQFMSGVQCLKRLYWQVHEPDLSSEPDAAAVAIMEQGREVGKLARQLFAGGVEVPFGDPEQAIRITVSCSQIPMSLPSSRRLSRTAVCLYE